MKLDKLLTSGTNITVSMTVGDLAEFAESLITKTKAELCNIQQEPIQDSLLTADELCYILKIKRPTLYRWQQKGYIIPVRIGGRTYYKKSDVVGISRGCSINPAA